MKCFNVNFEEIKECIPVDTDKFPKVVLGAGGHKRSTWIPLGNRDAQDMMEEEEDKCFIRDAHPLKTKSDKIILVKPNKSDDRILVLWRLPSGYRGSASINTKAEDALIIGNDQSWHSGRGATGETAECLAVLEPGQSLYGYRTGRRVEYNDWRLEFDGQKIVVSPVTPADEEEGELL